MVGMVPWPVWLGACHSFLREAEAVATGTAGCELHSTVRVHTSFYIINKLADRVHRAALVYLV